MNTSPDSNAIEYEIFLAYRHNNSKLRFISAINPFVKSAPLGSLKRTMSTIGLRQTQSVKSNMLLDFSKIIYHVHASIPHIKPFEYSFYAMTEKEREELVKKALLHQLFFHPNVQTLLNPTIVKEFPQLFSQAFFFLRKVTCNESRTSMRDSYKAVNQFNALYELQFSSLDNDPEKEKKLIKLALYSLYGLSLTDKPFLDSKVNNVDPQKLTKYVSKKFDNFLLPLLKETKRRTAFITLLDTKLPTVPKNQTTGSLYFEISVDYVFDHLFQNQDLKFFSNFILFPQNLLYLLFF